jgi:hypothetical protein
MVILLSRPCFRFCKIIMNLTLFCECGRNYPCSLHRITSMLQGLEFLASRDRCLQDRSKLHAAVASYNGPNLLSGADSALVHYCEVGKHGGHTRLDSTACGSKEIQDQRQHTYSTVLQ